MALIRGTSMEAAFTKIQFKLWTSQSKNWNYYSIFWGKSLENDELSEYMYNCNNAYQKKHGINHRHHKQHVTLFGQRKSRYK